MRLTPTEFQLAQVSTGGSAVPMAMSSDEGGFGSRVSLARANLAVTQPFGSESSAATRVARLGSALVVLLGVIPLVGWMADRRLLNAVRPNYIPMAPNTALVFVLLGAALWMLEGGNARGVRVARGAAALGLGIAGVRLAEFLVGVDLNVDRWLFSFPSESLGLAPVGRMAFFTAVAFVFASSAALAMRRHSKGAAADDHARAFALLTAFIGLVFLLGYAYGSPLLYGGRTIPMALPTALGFTVLGISIAVPLSLRTAAERRGVERALRAARDELEARVAERTIELEVANEELQRAVIELEERTEEAEGARGAAVDAEARYRTLVDGMPVGVVLVDASSVIVAANASAERILGVGADALRDRALLGGTWHLLDASGAPVAPEQSVIVVALRTGERQRATVGVERPDGTRAWIDIVAQPLPRPDDSSPRAVVATFADVTEERRLREQLLQSQKMEAVGQLAGGIAHDFNNILTAIMSFGQLVLSEMEPESPLRADVGEIQAAASRAAALTRQLLAFSRKQLLQPVALDLNDVVKNLEPMLRRLLGEDVELVCRPSSGVDAAKADPGQIEQIVMNLVVNARDAMPKGGRLTIETENATVDDAYAEGAGELTPGRYVVLVVSDTGTGMDRATIDRIFEPFFTTKAPGHGTGLGLSTVFGIVKQSGGHVTVYSEPGRGTTFRIYLPRSTGGAAAPAGATEHDTSVPRGTESILLVEDDPAVRQVATRILHRLGYRVLEAPTPAAAEAIVAAHPRAIQLVITDLVLPGMNGRELAEVLTLVEPDLRVLYFSGFTDDVVFRRGLLAPGRPFLAKPFTLEDLARHVRAALDGPPPLAPS